MLNLEVLEKLAQAATFSPWEARFDPEEVTLGGQKRQWQVYGKLKGFGIARHICQCGNWTELGENSEKNAAFIAACDPKTILALVAELRNAQDDQRELSEIHLVLEQFGLHGKQKRGILYLCLDRVETLVARVRELEDVLRSAQIVVDGVAGWFSDHPQLPRRIAAALTPSEPQDG